MDFRNKHIVITGAANGLGKAIADQLLAEGAILYLGDIDEKELAQRSESSDRVFTYVVDVSSKSSLEAWKKDIQKKTDHIDILINNAGVTVLAPFAKHTQEDWERVMGVNVFGVVYGCSVFLPMLQKSRKGWIVNISSIFGIVAMPSQAAYCASKYAIRGFSEVLWEELQDIGVSVVHPGGIATSIVDKAPSSARAYKEKLSTFFASRALKPERAASQLLEGLRNEKKRIFVGSEALIFDRMKRLFPIWGNNWCYRQIKKSMGFADVEHEILS